MSYEHDDSICNLHSWRSSKPGRYCPSCLDNQEIAQGLPADVQKLTDIEAQLSAALKVVEAARHHVNYAKEKQNCGPCFDYCPNAIDGDSDCECGGSWLWSEFKEFDSLQAKEKGK